MNYIRQFIDERRSEEFLTRIERGRFQEHIGATRGNDSKEYTRCPHCDRATVLIEHEWTPQLRLDPSEAREAVYFTCEWCNGEIEPRDIAPKTPRKPAVSAGWEDELERARRIA